MGPTTPLVHAEHEHPRRWQNDNAVKVRAMRAILRGGAFPRILRPFEMCALACVCNKDDLAPGVELNEKACVHLHTNAGTHMRTHNGRCVSNRLCA